MRAFDQFVSLSLFIAGRGIWKRRRQPTGVVRAAAQSAKGRSSGPAGYVAYCPNQ